MDEFDLQDIWKASDDQAQSYYQSIEPEVLEMAKAKSKSVLAKLRRNAIGDSVGGFILWGFFFYIFWTSPYFWLMAGSLALLTVVSIIPGIKFYKKLKAVPTQNVVESIRSYHNLLSEKLKKSKRRLLYFMPFFFVIGLVMGYTSEGKDLSGILELKVLLTTIGLSIVTMFVLHWLTFKFHIFYLYEKPINELKEILDDLEKEM